MKKQRYEICLYDEMHKRAALKHAVYSMFKTLQYPGDNSVWIVKHDMHHVPVKGKVIVRYSTWMGHMEHWESPVLMSPSHLDIAKQFDIAIEACGDSHHIYFEGVRIAEPPTDDGITYIDISAGS